MPSLGILTEIGSPKGLARNLPAECTVASLVRDSVNISALKSCVGTWAKIWPFVLKDPKPETMYEIRGRPGELTFVPTNLDLTLHEN